MKRLFRVYLLLLSDNGKRTAGIHVEVLDSPEFLWTVMLIVAVTHGSMMDEDKTDRCCHVVYSDWISSSPFLSCYYGNIITRHHTCKINIKYNIISSTFGYIISSSVVLHQEFCLVIYKGKQIKYERDRKWIESMVAKTNMNPRPIVVTFWEDLTEVWVLSVELYQALSDLC